MFDWHDIISLEILENYPQFVFSNLSVNSASLIMENELEVSDMIIISYAKRSGGLKKHNGGSNNTSMVRKSEL